MAHDGYAVIVTPRDNFEKDPEEAMMRFRLDAYQAAAETNCSLLPEHPIVQMNGSLVVGDKLVDVEAAGFVVLHYKIAHDR